MSIGGVLHNEIKRQARQMLIERGFQDNEIYDEYKVKISRKRYIVDVVGICDNKCVAVECGMLSGKNRISVLEKYFDEVYHLPYLDSTLVGKIEGYKREIRSNSSIIYRLGLEVDSLKQLMKIEANRSKREMQPKNDIKPTSSSGSIKKAVKVTKLSVSLKKRYLKTIEMQPKKDVKPTTNLVESLKKAIVELEELSQSVVELKQTMKIEPLRKIIEVQPKNDVKPMTSTSEALKWAIAELEEMTKTVAEIKLNL